jgi:hypothetical protein
MMMLLLYIHPQQVLYNIISSTLYCMESISVIHRHSEDNDDNLDNWNSQFPVDYHDDMMIDEPL